MANSNNANKQYSEREKQAFYAGKAYAQAKAGQRVNCRTKAERQSFSNGVKIVRGNRK